MHTFDVNISSDLQNPIIQAYPTNVPEEYQISDLIHLSDPPLYPKEYAKEDRL